MNSPIGALGIQNFRLVSSLVELGCGYLSVAGTSSIARAHDHHVTFDEKYTHDV
jgi:hypothetical protein